MHRIIMLSRKYMYIRIIAVGKTKDQYLKEGIGEYLKRITAFAKIELVIVEEHKTTKNVLPAAAKEAEAQQIIKQLKDDEFTVALDEHGEQPDSEVFAQIIDSAKATGKLTFIIGGHFGLHQSIFDKANKKIALSKLTFTHQMVRLILLEQIYRGFCISTGKKYHY